MVVRRAVVHGLEMVAQAKWQKAELKMLRFSLRVTRTDRIRNMYIRGTVQIELRQG